MKQLDFESSNYKHKEEIKIFVGTFNDMVDKYLKAHDNREADLKKVNTTIDKKTAALNKLEASLVDLGNKTEELKALKEFSSNEIKELDAKKGDISFTDSEVHKMELDDINAQIAAKRGKISKIEAKVDATKAKIKTSNDEKKLVEKELKDLGKQKLAEEEALFRTEEILAYISETKDALNRRIFDIINSPYNPIVEDEEEVEEIIEESVIDTPFVATPAFSVFEESESIAVLEEEPMNEEEEVSVVDYIDRVEFADEPVIEEPVMREVDLPVIEESPLEIEVKEEPVVEKNTVNSLLENKFKKEGLDFNSFTSNSRDNMLENYEATIQNMEILKKHGVPLEYTLDQSEIYYNISSQDLDDLLCIITTDDEGNGMGFTIDFTFNILSELSKINVDKLIDVYNSEFMNVNAKSGIIGLLKLTNPSLTDFEKNRRANIEILKSLGTNTLNDIISKHPEFVNMDNPLFINVLNVFDRNDLVEKLNADVDVIPKIIDYWRNN